MNRYTPTVSCWTCWWRRFICASSFVRQPRLTRWWILSLRRLLRSSCRFQMLNVNKPHLLLLPKPNQTFTTLTHDVLSKVHLLLFHVVVGTVIYLTFGSDQHQSVTDIRGGCVCWELSLKASAFFSCTGTFEHIFFCPVVLSAIIKFLLRFLKYWLRSSR